MKLSQSSLKVLHARYLRRDASGEVVETPDEMCRRVARAIAEPETRFGNGQAAALAEEPMRWIDDRALAASEKLANDRGPAPSPAIDPEPAACRLHDRSEFHRQSSNAVGNRFALVAFGKVDLANLDDYRRRADALYAARIEPQFEELASIVAQFRIDGIIVNKIARVVQDGPTAIQFDALENMRAVAEVEVGAGVDHGLRELPEQRRRPLDHVRPPMIGDEHHVDAAFRLAVASRQCGQYSDPRLLLHRFQPREHLRRQDRKHSARRFAKSFGLFRQHFADLHTE